MDTIALIKDYLQQACTRMFAEPRGDMKHKCLLPVAAYSMQLWDWGCWTSNIAVRQLCTDNQIRPDLAQYEIGCRLNFFDAQTPDGKIPIAVSVNKDADLTYFSPDGNPHKPVMAQHCAFIIKYTDDSAWLAPYFVKLEKFIAYYEQTSKHESGLFFFIDDFAIGVDNDPCTFFRPRKSSASIYLNTLMYKELLAMSYLAEKLSLDEQKALYADKATELLSAIQEHCWDRKDGMFYSCDLNLLPIDPTKRLHRGCPRHWNTMLQRYGMWSSFMPLWAGIATPEQAERMVQNLTDPEGFWAPYGIRSMSKYEKQYRIIKSGNPSCWHGPIWGISNYMVFKGLLRYNYTDLATELCDKTIALFGRDLQTSGAFHEYYDPESGEGVHNKDFLSWNMLVANMIAWREGKEVIEEF